MRKYIAAALVLVLLSFAGCGDDTVKPDNETASTKEIADTTVTIGTTASLPDPAESQTEGYTAEQPTDSTNTTDSTVLTAAAEPDGESVKTSVTTTVTSKETDKKETDRKETTKVTVTFTETFRKGESELPDDVWE